jgi:hypothetical protein
MNRFPADVRIEAGKTPAKLDSPAGSGVLWQASAGQFLIEVPGTARYLVTGGSTIVIEKRPEALPERVARFLGMAPLAALLYQRGVFACHASCIATAQGAVLITGLSGSGKSTLAAALIDRGCSLLADDIAAVGLNAECRPAVHATESEIVLWPDAIQQLFAAGLPPHVRSPAGDHDPAHAVPLCGIVRLSSNALSCDQDDTQMKRFEQVTRMTWNSRIADVLLDRGAHLQLAAAIARHIPVKTLFRSKTRWAAGELADTVLEKWG